MGIGRELRFLMYLGIFLVACWAIGYIVPLIALSLTESTIGLAESFADTASTLWIGLGIVSIIGAAWLLRGGVPWWFSTPVGMVYIFWFWS